MTFFCIYNNFFNLGKLYEKYDKLYCKLLKDIINDKEYIKSLREKSNKDYKEYLKKIFILTYWIIIKN
jgi:hypothetical protein